MLAMAQIQASLAHAGEMYTHIHSDSWSYLHLKTPVLSPFGKLSKASLLPGLNHCDFSQPVLKKKKFWMEATVPVHGNFYIWLYNERFAILLK